MRNTMLVEGTFGDYVCGWRPVGFVSAEVVVKRARRVFGFLWRPVMWTEVQGATDYQMGREYPRDLLWRYRSAIGSYESFTRAWGQS